MRIILLDTETEKVENSFVLTNQLNLTSDGRFLAFFVVRKDAKGVYKSHT